MLSLLEAEHILEKVQYKFLKSKLDLICSVLNTEAETLVEQINLIPTDLSFMYRVSYIHTSVIHVLS